MAETAKQREAREAREAAEAAAQTAAPQEGPQGEQGAAGDDTPADAQPPVQSEQEPVSEPEVVDPEAPALAEPTLAETRDVAGVALASAEARYYAGQGSKEELDAARSAWKATRRG